MQPTWARGAMSANLQSHQNLCALLDRGWGKPQQATEMDWRLKPASLMTDEELMAIARGGITNA
jgi:hypothetical protein